MSRFLVGVESLLAASCMIALGAPESKLGKPVPAEPASTMRVEMDASRARTSFLSWDTEGGDRAKFNLLRAPVKFRVRSDGDWRTSKNLPTRCQPLDKGGMRYQLDIQPDAQLMCEVRPLADRLSMTVSGHAHTRTVKSRAARAVSSKARV
jgi:hypothetical protein